MVSGRCPLVSPVVGAWHAATVSHRGVLDPSAGTGADLLGIRSYTCVYGFIFVHRKGPDFCPTRVGWPAKATPLVPLTGIEPVRCFHRGILSAFPQKADSGNDRHKQLGAGTSNPHSYAVSEPQIRQTRIVTGFSEKVHFSENLSRTP